MTCCPSNGVFRGSSAGCQCSSCLSLWFSPYQTDFGSSAGCRLRIDRDWRGSRFQSHLRTGAMIARVPSLRCHKAATLTVAGWLETRILELLERKE